MGNFSRLKVFLVLMALLPSLSHAQLARCTSYIVGKLDDMTQVKELNSHLQKELLQDQDQIFEGQHPYYFGYCVSTFAATPNGSSSRSHSSLMLGGTRVQKDVKTGLPILQVVDDERAGQETAAISVSAFLKNAEFLITEKDFFINPLKAEEEFTQEKWQEVAAMAVDRGLYDGIEFHDDWVVGDLPKMEKRLREWEQEKGGDENGKNAKKREKLQARVKQLRQLKENILRIKELQIEEITLQERIKKNDNQEKDETLASQLSDLQEQRAQLEREVKIFVAAKGVGWDFAQTLNRNLYCIKIPVDLPVLKELVTNLNKVQTSHAPKLSSQDKIRLLTLSKSKLEGQALSETETQELAQLTQGLHQWDVVCNNCVHPIINALAPILHRQPLQTNLPLKKQVFGQFVAPGNFLIDLVNMTWEEDLNYRSIFQDPSKREALLQYQDNWFPLAVGTLVTRQDMHTPNSQFVSDERVQIIPEIGPMRTLGLTSFYHKNSHKDQLQDIADKIEYRVYEESLKYSGKKFRDELARIQDFKKSRNYAKSQEDLKNFLQVYEQILSRKAAQADDQLQKLKDQGKLISKE